MIKSHVLSDSSNPKPKNLIPNLVCEIVQSLKLKNDNAVIIFGKQEIKQ